MTESERSRHGKGSPRNSNSYKIAQKKREAEEGEGKKKAAKERRRRSYGKKQGFGEFVRANKREEREKVRKKSKRL
ncbi:hypothetical protein L6R29_03520 [Myxococcota bacterium]|nr:hypothetical protein [Myxococcota bacterium]